jgi:hypothetical protein
MPNMTQTTIVFDRTYRMASVKNEIIMPQMVSCAHSNERPTAVQFTILQADSLDIETLFLGVNPADVPCLTPESPATLRTVGIR